MRDRWTLLRVMEELMRIGWTLLPVLLAACEGPAPASRPGAALAPVEALPLPAPASQPGGVVDSILPPEEEIRRFRLTAPGTPSALTGGAISRDGLVRRWVRALERGDTLALAGMLLNAEEFITFYYPESPYTRPPYRQSPRVRWMLMRNVNDQGATRVLRRHGGASLGFRGYQCPWDPEILGRNRIWTGCAVRFVEAGDVVERRLFGPILERGGRFKFLTYGSAY